MNHSYCWCDGMKIGKAEIFVLCYIPIYLLIVLFANAFFLTTADCPGGGCDEITLFEAILLLN